MKIFKNVKPNTFYCIIIALLLIFTASFAMAADISDIDNLDETESINQWGPPSESLQQKINALSDTAVASISIPVLFGIEIEDVSPNFGAPRSGGRTHEGEDIMAIKGTPIVSPTPAVVLRTGTGPTAGNYVYTANPGGETFVYMHLDQIGEGVAMGTILERGSLVGYVGDTGNASGGAAHLHLEIRNSADIATNPFPRLTSEFSLQEKISFLSKIITQTSNSATLLKFIAVNFPDTFTAALSADANLSSTIINSLATTPENLTSSTELSVPTTDLDVGSSGAGVIALQKFLIQANSGTTAAQLEKAGATGYFGTTTKAALAEYQTANKISPAKGYYGAATRAFIASHPLIATESNPSVALTRNLYQGISGEDVRALQKILNANGYIISKTGLGSLGNETTYFGQATKAAVIKFQIAKGISPAAGYVGSITRSALTSL
ncbi:MAG: peptidoglycan-binding protein [Candidatus Paceibacterota bacterium]